MTYTALYTTLYRLRGVTRTVTKVAAWVLGLQFAVLYLLASVADAPLTQLAGPALRFGVVLAAFYFAPRAFDAGLRWIAGRQAASRSPHAYRE